MEVSRATRAFFGLPIGEARFLLLYCWLLREGLDSFDPAKLESVLTIRS